MSRKIIFLAAILVCFFYLFPSYALKKQLTKYEILAAAGTAMVNDGFQLTGVEVMYDKDNQMWRERVNRMADLMSAPHFKLFERGFMKNYQAVLYNFREPSGEVWVFVDRDSGEVLEIYRPEYSIQGKQIKNN
ncbi:MAG: hypothetical protein PHP17_06465 [Candidatus Omnitrophica bacterium]|nr:hypothetical protein [Candidatus Omnitrophota bacterium]